MPHTVYAPLPAVRDAKLDPFDADQRTRIPAAAALAAITPATAVNPVVANLRNPALVAACRRAELPPLTPAAVAVLIEIAEMKEGADPNYVKFLDCLAALIWRAGDAGAVLAEVASLISAVRAEDATR
ncbi:hypothetical protein ACFWP3_26350 [Streptomyces sp. NPDC058525]|uniref:hypothetical protein n=1 Tax=Streptomyces sp. NPDC058525 TaxID=3346538 RepID=UPI0036587C87